MSRTAVGGEIDALDAGGYGTLTITQAITIDGGGGQVASVLASGVPGFIVNVGPTEHVILRNLRINGINQYSNPGTTGVNFVSGGSLRLENDSIFGFSRDGVNDSSPNSSLGVLNSTIDNNGGDGVVVAPPAGNSAQATLENDALENNQCGLAAGAFGGGGPGSNCGMPTSGSAASRVTVSLAGSSSSSNGQSGVFSDGSPTTVYLSNASVFGNSNGLRPINGGSIVSVGANNSVYGNGTDGSPTSMIATGAVGPQVPPGTAGPQGVTGQPGTVVLVTCKTTTRKVKVRHKNKKTTTKTITVQHCTARPITGTVRFTVTGHLARATLARDGKVYATGKVGVSGGSTTGYLRLRVRLRASRYVMTLWHGQRVIERRTVLVR